MRRVLSVLAVVALIAAVLIASAAPAMAKEKEDHALKVLGIDLLDLLEKKK